MEFNCYWCHQKIEVAGVDVGDDTICPSCEHPVRVPGPGDSSLGPSPEVRAQNALNAAKKGMNRADGKKQVASGIALIVIAALITGATYLFAKARGGGLYLISVGGFGWGVYNIVQGSLRAATGWKWDADIPTIEDVRKKDPEKAKMMEGMGVGLMVVLIIAILGGLMFMMRDQWKILFK